MLQPNKAHLWVPCPLAGNVMTSGQYEATTHADPAYDTDDARREGICAHWAGELLLRGEVEQPRELVGLQHANGWIIDEPMAFHAMDYRDYVARFGPHTAVEKHIDLFGLIRGRLDTVSSRGVIRIFDFKYGYRLVEVRQNFTMLCYGLYAWAESRASLPIEMHIFQPRPHHPDGHARAWRIEAEEVSDWWDWLRDRAADCFAPHTPGIVGKHCLDCPAAGSCHALTANVYGAYETVVSDRMSEYTPTELAAFLTFLDMAEKLVDAKRKAMRAEAEARISRGTFIPGWLMDQRTGNREWTVTPDQRRRATGVDPMKQVEKSPAELEREGVPKDVVNQMSKTKKLGRKLSNDPQSAARRMFKD
jgi:hypothetical protein